MTNFGNQTCLTLGLRMSGRRAVERYIYSNKIYVMGIRVLLNLITSMNKKILPLSGI